MQFVADRAWLTSALKMNMKTVKDKSPLPVLACVHLSAGAGQVECYSTDYEQALSTRFYAEVNEPGEVALPCKRLLEVVHSLSGELVSLNVDPETYAASIKAGKSRTRLMGVEPAEMVHLPQLKEPCSFLLSEGFLKEIIGRVAHAASKSDLRPAYTGVSIHQQGDRMQWAAMDGHVLATYCFYFDEPLSQEFSVIVPRQTLLDLFGLLRDEEEDVLLEIDGQQISFTVEDRFQLTARLIQGQYPNYQRILPTEANCYCVVERVPLIEAFKRLALVAKEGDHCVSCTLTDDTLELKAEGYDGSTAEEEVPAKVEGDKYSLYLHDEQMLSLLNGFTEDQVRLFLNGPARPVRIDPIPGGYYQAVIVPLLKTSAN